MASRFPHFNNTLHSKPEGKTVKQFMSNYLDGLDGIIENNDSSVRRILQSILFFEKNKVQQQAQDVVKRIDGTNAIPVRFNANQPFYKQNEVRQTTPTFKNKKEARLFAKENPLFHKETGIQVCIDSDGNYVTKKDITKYTGHILSGKKPTAVNYTIAHIWGKTDNPFYFSLMWNYCLVPNPYSFLMDRKDEISQRIQNVAKAVSIELYNPNGLMNNKITVELPPKDAFAEAKRLISENKIRFVPVNN